jgi:murein DD-endopeptidase MepM/ murein hydrolase activator NlpD
MQSKKAQLVPLALRVLIPGGLVLVGACLHLATRALESQNRYLAPFTQNLPFNPRLTLPNESSSLVAQARVPVEMKLARGETVAQMLSKLGLGTVEAHEATNALAASLDFRKLRAGSRYSAFFNPDSRLTSLEITLDGSGRVEMKRRGEDWLSSWQPFDRHTQYRALSGTLEGSFEESIRAAGGPVSLTYRLADIFQWDLDFARDLRRGDRFQVVYEEILLDGKVYDVGTVVAAAYDNHGRMHEAYRFGDSGTYYDGDGRPLRKMFLRSPLRYSRITSQFSQHRFHPVLHEFRPHYGVDYGAPVGTPVMVTASGTVDFAGWDRGGGRVVKVRHTSGYTTAYLHLSRFGSGIHPGARVRQGDVIAFTGMTGLATGPHLDYRVRLGERWIDPLSLKSVRDEPIPSARLASFRLWRDDLRSNMRAGGVLAGLRIPGFGGTQHGQHAVGGEAPAGAPTQVAR